MGLVHWLKQIQLLTAQGGGLCGQWASAESRRHSRRNRQHGIARSAVIQTEPLETRVLLTTTDGLDLNLAAYSPTNPYSSTLNNSSETYSQVSNNYLNTSSFSTAISNSPVDPNMGSASNQLQTYLTSGR
jgi:hypothetical protein